MVSMDGGLISLQDLETLEKALDASHGGPLLIFKHSFTCGVSAEALDELRAHLDERAASGAIRCAMVTVQTHRDVSNAISARLGVRHETPQAILVRGGRAVWTASHFRVNSVELGKALSSV
jgi:bacillithiol system protein YtxJ